MRNTVMRVAVVAGMSALLASCATNGDPQNPAAGISNPFSGLFDPDLRGSIGGKFDTSGRGGEAVAPAEPTTIGPLGQQSEVPPDGDAAAVPPATQGPSATTHTVEAGETAWSISRKYGVNVADLAAANALPEAMTVRTGQTLTIPAASGAASDEGITRPGAGSPTPMPPSASQPLPGESTAPASSTVDHPESPDLGSTRTAASSDGKFRMPVDGPIVRGYAKGVNDGIDIAAPAGASVKAASGGTVAAVTRDTKGQPIVVIRHEDTLMTVYTGLSDLSVSKGDSVSAGQTIGQAGNSGEVHFEVRRGFNSANPADYLG